jgi:PPOX class probable F420-dependent enzyme
MDTITSMPPLTDDQIKLLSEPVMATVATTMADGSPQATPVWIDTDGEAILFNTAKGRVKYNNLVRDPRAAVVVLDRNDDYRTVVARGHVEFVEEGADAHIDKLAKKYLGKDHYPWHKADEQRVIVRLVPDKIHVR